MNAASVPFGPAVPPQQGQAGARRHQGRQLWSLPRLEIEWSLLTSKYNSGKTHVGLIKSPRYSIGVANVQVTALFSPWWISTKVTEWKKNSIEWLLSQTLNKLPDINKLYTCNSHYTAECFLKAIELLLLNGLVFSRVFLLFLQLASLGVVMFLWND